MDAKNNGKNVEDGKDGLSADEQSAGAGALPINMPKASIPPELIYAPRFSLPAETISATQEAQEIQKNLAASISTFDKNYNALQSSLSDVCESAKAISSVFSGLIDCSSMVQGMCPVLRQVIEQVREATKGIDIQALAESMRPLALKARRIEILDKANWPMYLVNDETLCDALDLLPENITEADIRERVTDIAREQLGAEWLAETKGRWQEHDEISTGEMRLLSSALERHAKGDYEGCVSLLMGLLEGLLCKYAPILKELDDEQTELFDMNAKTHGLSPSHKTQPKETRETTRPGPRTGFALRERLVHARTRLELYRYRNPDERNGQRAGRAQPTPEQNLPRRTNRVRHIGALPKGDSRHRPNH